MNITQPQFKFIQDIVRNLEGIGFDVRFDGTTRQEASTFIDKYGNYAKDVERLKNGKRPWHSMIHNQWPKDIEIHNFMVDANLAFTRYEVLSQTMSDGFGEQSWGDDWS